MENIRLSCLFPPISQVVKDNVPILTYCEKNPCPLMHIASGLVEFRSDRSDCSGLPIETVTKD